MKIKEGTPLHSSMQDMVKDMKVINREMEKRDYILFILDLVIKFGIITIIGIVISKLMKA